MRHLLRLSLPAAAVSLSACRLRQQLIQQPDQLGRQRTARRADEQQLVKRRRREDGL